MPKPADSRIAAGQKPSERLRRELGIATSEEFFVETYDQKERGPEQGKLERARSVQCEPPEVKSMSSMQGKQQQSYRAKAPQCAVPEQFAKSPAQRQTINSERAVLNSAHGHRWKQLQ